MTSVVNDYFESLCALPQRTIVTDPDGRKMQLEAFIGYATRAIAGLRDTDSKLIFVGNGGSASIASHMAEDFSKNVGVPAMCFNDGAMLTALSNDEGFEHVFSRQIGFYGRPGDLLIAISSSGNSVNILNAVEAARAKDISVITLSGFKPDNKLRQLGDFNLYVPSGEYGFVEIMHLSLVHSLIDLTMGWTRESGLWSPGETPAQSSDKKVA